MAASVLSSITTTWANGDATPADQDITIPVDTTAVYIFWQMDTTAASPGGGISSITLEAVSPDETHQIQSVGSAAATGVAAWYNPGVGANQTIALTWLHIPADVCPGIIVFTKDGETIAWRDADAASDTLNDASTVVLDSSANDLVMKFDVAWTGFPAVGTGWTNIATIDSGNFDGRASSLDSPGTTASCTTEEDVSYSSVAAVSVPPLIEVLGGGIGSRRRFGARGIAFIR